MGSWLRRFSQRVTKLYRDTVEEMSRGWIVESTSPGSEEDGTDVSSPENAAGAGGVIIEQDPDELMNSLDPEQLSISSLLSNVNDLRELLLNIYNMIGDLPPSTLAQGIKGFNLDSLQELNRLRGKLTEEVTMPRDPEIGPTDKCTEQLDFLVFGEHGRFRAKQQYGSQVDLQACASHVAD